MKILVIGSGAREDAIAWKLSTEPEVERIFVAPGNPGTAKFATNFECAVDQLDQLLEFALSNKIDLTIVGPELPLSLGIVDLFRSKGLRIFGPNKEASQLESSKSFAKAIMQQAGVRTAGYVHVNTITQALQALLRFKAPLVLKADGLASGKGVVICDSIEQAQSACKELLSKHPQGGLVIEEFIKGIEASFIVATDGKKIAALSSAHDYKRVFDADQGPNTGGMGSVSPTPRLDPARHDEVISEVIRPVLREMERIGIQFQGFLYAGLMLEPNGKVSVLEFNARLGDPETQSILRRLKSSFASLLFELSEPLPKKEGIIELSWDPRACVCVVMAAQGYPDKPQTGFRINGIEQAELIKDLIVFHAGTKLDAQGNLLSAGGRVLSVTVVADSIASARAIAYQGCKKITFESQHYRSDIGVS